MDKDDDSEALGGIKSTDYLETESGCPISKPDRQQLYAHAQLIWASFAKASKQGPPAGFKMTDIQHLTQYRNEMEKEFPILQLCARHWKADQVWILNYPSWLRNWEIKVQRTEGKHIKTEGKKVPGEKCKHKDEKDSAARKKQKEAHEMSSNDVEKAKQAPQILIVSTVIFRHWNSLKIYLDSP